jgi:rhamnopyranosyl-N-acetylglucosaminyl-diphospho-decaprenol beta-1,3/1,4-galactofuranosyltransferase
VVVTYNRRELLVRCLDRLISQTRPADLVVIVDNGSTDGTAEYLAEKGYIAVEKIPPNLSFSKRRGGGISQHAAGGVGHTIEYVRLDNNTGGAGGFACGLEIAYQSGAEWLWLMDDDAQPEQNALAALMAEASDEAMVYSSTAIVESDPAGERLCWPARQLREGRPNRPMFLTTQMDALTEVEDLPFLGFLIHRSLVKRIGFPDSAFFISSDDLDYSLRARRAGAKLLVVKSSLIFHPGPSRRIVRLPWRAIGVVDFPAWRRYYEVRNRIVVARRHHGIGLWTHTIPGTLIRWAIAMLVSSDRLLQSKAYLQGIIDGLCGRLGVVWVPGGN